jgi:hypothetical protein
VGLYVRIITRISQICGIIAAALIAAYAVIALGGRRNRARAGLDAPPVGAVHCKVFLSQPHSLVV